MKKRFLVVLIAIVAVVCLTLGLSACERVIIEGGISTYGTYYLYENGNYDKTNYVVLNKSSWSDSNGKNGTYSIVGMTDEYEKPITNQLNIQFNEIVLKQTQNNETVEFKRGLLRKGYITFESEGEEVIYCQEVSAMCEFRKYKNYYSLFRYLGEFPDITIPSEYKGLPVTTIGPSAFYYYSDAVNVTLPNSITTIDNKAFNGCTNLASITIPDSVTSIGSEVFNSCSAVTVYCEATQAQADWNENSLSSIPVVYDCNNNDVATDGNIYTMIGGIRYALKDNKATVVKQSTALLNNKTILENVSYNGNNYTVTSIASSSFSGCKMLRGLTIPDSITSIGNNSFSNCSQIINYTGPTLFISYLPDSIVNATLTSGTEIKNNEFSRFKSLKSVTIPDSIISIGSYAFANCSNLTSIEIPDSVTTIGSNVFNSCRALTVYCEATQAQAGWNLDSLSSFPIVYDCKNNDVANDGYIYTIIDGIRYALKDDNATVVKQAISLLGDKTILENVSYKGNNYTVTSIVASSFSSCQELRELTIPDCITSIGDTALSGCSKLESINFNGTIAEWNAITKGNSWNSNTSAYTITCTDGTLDKDGNVVS
ncbi:MAG: leucine-rich repeat domain-containing protein [Candidatus Coproplasma sp.]